LTLGQDLTLATGHFSDLSASNFFVASRALLGVAYRITTMFGCNTWPQILAR